jgi:hypothetical protein
MHVNRTILIIAALVTICAAGIAPASAVYKNNDTIWTSGGNMLVLEDFIPYIDNSTHYPSSFQLAIKPSQSAIIIIPFTSSSMKNGIRPKVRNLTFDMFLPVGVNATEIWVYSGTGLLDHRTLSWRGTAARREYLLDLGSYKLVNKGITVGLRIRNDRPSSLFGQLFGASAKQEW